MSYTHEYLANPDMMLNWHDDNKDVDGIAFMYTTDHQLVVGPAYKYHGSIIGRMVDTGPGGSDNDNLFGRVGYYSYRHYGDGAGDKVVSFWDTSDVGDTLLKPCLEELIRRGYINQNTEVHTFGNGVMTVAAMLGGYISDPEQAGESGRQTEKAAGTKQNWELLRKMHLMRGDEKKAAMKELGLYNPEKAEHPWQKSMREKGLIGPGQKWWAQYSESTGVSQAILEAWRFIKDNQRAVAKITPDDIFNAARHNSNALGATFIYTYDHELWVGDIRDVHPDVAEDHGLDEYGRDALTDNGILGRAGMIGGQYVVSFWNNDESEITALPDCLKALIEHEIVSDDTPVYTYWGRSSVSEILKDGSVFGPGDKSSGETVRAQDDETEKQDWELLRKMHLMRGDEKKDAMKKLGLFNPKKAEHPWQKSMREKGLIGPGQKWWATQSESRKFTRELEKALSEEEVGNSLQNPSDKLEDPDGVWAMDSTGDFSPGSGSDSSEEPDLQWRDPDAVLIDPDRLYMRASAGSEGATFIYTYDGTLHAAPPDRTHFYISNREHLVNNPLRRMDIAEFGLLGRSGWHNGRYVVSFWNTDAEDYIVLQDCLKALLEKGLTTTDAEIHTYNGVNKVSDVLAGGDIFGVGGEQSNKETAKAQGDETRKRNWELLKKMHLLRGDEKKEAMKELGLYNPEKAEHPMAAAMKKSGNLIPGGKWWAPQSESRSFDKSLNEALVEIIPKGKQE